MEIVERKREVIVLLDSPLLSTSFEYIAWMTIFVQLCIALTIINNFFNTQDAIGKLNEKNEKKTRSLSMSLEYHSNQ